VTESNSQIEHRLDEWDRMPAMSAEAQPGHRIVVFIDMLGFSELVNRFDSEIPLGGFRDFHFSSLEELDRQLRFTDHPLEHRFATFHGVIESHVRRQSLNDAPHSVTFSDSAFVAFHFPVMAYRFAIDVMRDLIIRNTPARMGIAPGTFRGRRYSSDATEHVHRYSFQFFGTGVVAAHQVEECGLKGMRILLHPDLSQTDHPVFTAIADPVDPAKPLKIPVAHELNYAIREYPTFMHTPDDPDEFNFDADPLTVKIELMAREASDEPGVQIQYQRTQEAILRMRGLPGPNEAR